MGKIHVNYFKFGPVVQEMEVYGRRTHNGRRPNTIAHIEPSAQVIKKSFAEDRFCLSKQYRP